MDASSVFDPDRSFEKSLNNAVMGSTLSFSGHVDAAAYSLALRTYFMSRTGLRLSSNATVGGHLELTAACVQLLPPSLASPAMRHLARGVPETYFMQEFHQDSYYLVTNERVKSVSSGDGSRVYQGLDESPRPKVLFGSSLRTLAVGRFLAELIQLPYDASLADILRTLPQNVRRDGPAQRGWHVRRRVPRQRRQGPARRLL